LTRKALLPILLALALLASGCGVDVGAGEAAGNFEPKRPGTLTVVTQPLPTAGFWEGTGQRPTGGVEYGMARELADRLGLERVVVRTERFSRIAAGELGDADLAMALITPTGEREEALDFSSPYFEAAPALVANSGTEIPDVQTAQELRWALGRNTTFEDIVAEQIRPDEEPLYFESRVEEIEALADGRAEVAMFDLPAALAIEATTPELEVVAKLAQTEPIAIALPEESGENTEAVSSAVRAMIADGTLDELTDRWLGVSITDAEAEVPLLRTKEP
jgi:polar amino acid transport system substrate-binding protein